MNTHLDMYMEQVALEKQYSKKYVAEQLKTYLIEGEHRERPGVWEEPLSLLRGPRGPA